MCAFDIAVYSSDSEGFSNAVLEYMACGNAIVATANGGNAELINHEQDGLLVPVNNAEAMAKEVVRLLRDVDLREKLGKNAHEKVQRAFSMEKMVHQHEEFYASLVPCHLE